MEESGFSSQLRYGIQTLSSPQGALGILLWVLLLVALLFSPKVKWFALVGMMWCAALSFYVEEFSLVRLAFPLEQIRSQGRPLCTAFLVALLLPAALASRGWRRSVISKPLLIFFIFEMCLGTRIMLAGVRDRATVTLIVFPILFAVLGWGLSKWMQDWKDAHRVVRCIAGAGAIYVIGICYQLAINRSAILRGNRLMGTSGNPQLAALLMSVSLPALCYLVARKAESMTLRVLGTCLVGFMIIMLIWTGSRTGLLIATTGVLVTFWARLGRFIAVGILVGLFVMLAYQIYGESTVALADMLRRGDTRSHVWRDMWQMFLREPILGYMEGEFGVGENSYLSVAAVMGLFGLIPLLTFLFLAGLALVRGFHLRRWLGPERHFTDMCMGGVVALLAGAIFEGYLLGTLTFPVFGLYIYLSMLNFANDMGSLAQQQAAYEGEYPVALGGEMMVDPVAHPYSEQFT